MNIKVGDIIRYNGRDVRVMKLNNFPKLAYFLPGVYSTH